MLKFLTQRVSTKNSYSYYFQFFVQADPIGFNVEKSSKHYVNKFRETLLEINQTLPRFAEAKWYSPMPYDDKHYVKSAKMEAISLIDQPDAFIAETIQENKEHQYSIDIGSTWDGIHPAKYPANFYYHHSSDPEFKYIAFRDYLNLHFYIPNIPDVPNNNFDYSKDWALGFSFEELEQIITIINRHYNIIHADLCDAGFVGRSVPENALEDYYEDSYQVFPHRFGTTWMTVLDKPLTAEQVPEAAKVVPMEKGRTLVMSVADDYFNSYNPEHVLKANLLELRLQYLGVLRPSDAVE